MGSEFLRTLNPSEFRVFGNPEPTIDFGFLEREPGADSGFLGTEPETDTPNLNFLQKYVSPSRIEAIYR
jgi:hypothetical protein